MSTDQQHIQHLLDRFMAGESTLAEEQELSRYLATHEVDSEWKAYQDMFAYFDAGMAATHVAEGIATPKRVAPVWIRWAAAAAIVAIVATVAFKMWNQPQPESQIGRYAQVSGQSVSHGSESVNTKTLPPKSPTHPAVDAKRGQRFIVTVPRKPKRRMTTSQPSSRDVSTISHDDAEMELALMHDVAMEAELEDQLKYDELEWALLQASTAPRLVNVDYEPAIK